MTLVLAACGPVEGPEQAVPSEVQAVVRKARLEAEAVALGLSPEIPVDPDVPSNQAGSVMARAGDISLVVWVEALPGGLPDILAARVRASDGVVLDTEPLPIATGEASVQMSPSVASDGRDFLVVWQEIGPSSPTVYGRRVRASDGTLGATTLINQGNGLPQFSPSVGYGDGVYLVAWQGLTFVPSNTMYGPPMRIAHAFQGMRVRALDGQLLDPKPFVIAQTESSAGAVTTPSVAHAQGRFLVSWVDGLSTQIRLYARRYGSVNGAPLDPGPITLSATAQSHKGPTSASNGLDFLVAWGDAGNGLRATRVRGADGAVLDGSGVQLGASLQDRPSLAFDGDDYRLYWGQQTPEAVKLWVTRVSPNGPVASAADLVLDSQPPSSTLASGAVTASGRGRFLVSYTREVQGSVPLNQLFLRQVVDLPNGEACTQADECQSGSCVDGVCCESACGGGVATDCQACSVAAGGQSNGACTVVSAQAQVVCRGSAVACDVAEVCDGTSALCPADEPAAREPDLSGDKCEDSPCDVAAYVSALGERSLTAKAEGACQASRQGNAQATRGKLSALLHEVQAQRGKKLDASVADTLIAALTGMLGAL